MQTLQFSVPIRAPREKVWHCLWNIHYYETWTAEFSEESTVQTDNWKEGTQLYFHDGRGNGMVSRVSANRTNEFMSFTHLGMILDGVEDLSSEKVMVWAGATESYQLSDADDGTLLLVNQTVPEDYVEYFQKTCALAHEKLKALAEGRVQPMIRIGAVIQAPIDKVWEAWTQPEHVKQWNHASDDWHCPAASNEFRTGGTFSFTMAAKDGSFSFDFGGVYTAIEPHKMIHVTLEDGRIWKTWFTEKNGTVEIIEKFEAEQMNPLELQQGGWQAILNNFKQYTEQL